jgi:hypothetical protein
MGEEAPGETGAARVSFPAVLFCCIEGFFVLFVCVCVCVRGLLETVKFLRLFGHGRCVGRETRDISFFVCWSTLCFFPFPRFSWALQIFYRALLLAQVYEDATSKACGKLALPSIRGVCVWGFCIDLSSSPSFPWNFFQVFGRESVSLQS